MIVLDASVVVDLLLDLPPYAGRIVTRIREEAPALVAPHLLDAEAGQVVRRYVLRGEVSVADAEAALEDLAALPITRYPHTPLIARAFALRANATVYDALYLVLAEALAAPLLTRDTALATIPGHGAQVEVVG
jgi:predicted nucleic acid-binding protein